MQGVDGSEGGVVEDFGRAVAAGEEEGGGRMGVRKCCLVGLKWLRTRGLGGWGGVDGYWD